MNLRNKLLLSFLIFIAALVALGAWSALSLRELGEVSRRIIASNYDSVVAAQDMKESLERMDSAAVFLLLGNRDRAMAQFNEHRARFDVAFGKAATNITGASRPSSPKGRGGGPKTISSDSNRYSIKSAPSAISFYSSISGRWPRSPTRPPARRGANSSSLWRWPAPWSRPDWRSPFCWRTA